MNNMEKLNLQSGCYNSGAKHANVLEKIVEKSSHAKSRKRRTTDNHDKTNSKIPKTKMMSERLESIVTENPINNTVAGSTSNSGTTLNGNTVAGLNHNVENGSTSNSETTSNDNVENGSTSNSGTTSNDNVENGSTSNSGTTLNGKVGTTLNGNVENGSTSNSVIETNGNNLTNNSSNETEMIIPKGNINVITKYEEQYCNPPAYCLQQNKQIYAKNVDGDDKYFFDKNGIASYAIHIINDEQIEVPAKTKNGKIKYLKDKETGRDKIPYNYAKSQFIFQINAQSGMPIYPADPITNELYYPTILGKEYYGMDIHNNEIPFTNKQGDMIYAKTLSGDEIYPKTKDQDEYYIKRGNMEIFAIKANGDTFYAEKQNGDQFYPKSFQEIILNLEESNVDIDE